MPKSTCLRASLCGSAKEDDAAASTPAQARTIGRDPLMVKKTTIPQRAERASHVPRPKHKFSAHFCVKPAAEIYERCAGCPVTTWASSIILAEVRPREMTRGGFMT